MGVRRRIAPEAGRAAVRTWLAADPEARASLPRPVLATAVRYALEELSEVAEGNSVEVRVPPFGVAQCIEGPRHTRGTPPNVVEVNPQTWLGLVTGITQWDSALSGGGVSASGLRADLSGLLPLFGTL